MKRNATLIAVLAIAVAGGSIWLRGTAAPASNAAAVHAAAQTAAQQVSTSTATTISAPMQSTGKQFASSSDYAAAYVVFPALASNAAQALGACSIQKTDLGDGSYKITLVNNSKNASGQNYQNVTVTSGQSVYFVERASRDDTASEDFGAQDDYLVAVDAAGNILQ